MLRRQTVSTCTSGKVQHPTEEAARLAVIAGIAVTNVYRCHICRAWHTSKKWPMHRRQRPGPRRKR
jgi:hypothetical protein